MLDLKNVRKAVRIPSISCLEAEIRTLEVYRPPSWTFPLPASCHGQRISFICRVGTEQVLTVLTEQFL